MNRWTHRAVAAAMLACAGLASTMALGDGDVHEKIARIGQQIAAQPDTVGLYLRRAELYRIHREWDPAEADYAQVLKMDPGHPEVSWLRARSLVEAGKAAAALPEVDRQLAKTPGHPSALLTRARALAALGRNADAAPAYAAAIERLAQPEPDHYLEQWNAQQGAGHSAALQLVAIEKGIQRLGSVPSLEDAALSVELRSKQWDAALARLDRQAATAARKERWLYRRGLILMDAGRLEHASAAFRTSLDEVEKLPPALKNPRATMALVEQVRRELKKLGVEAEPAAEAKL